MSFGEQKYNRTIKKQKSTSVPWMKTNREYYSFDTINSINNLKKAMFISNSLLNGKTVFIVQFWFLINVRLHFYLLFFDQNKQNLCILGLTSIAIFFRILSLVCVLCLIIYNVCSNWMCIKWACSIESTNRSLWSSMNFYYK